MKDEKIDRLLRSAAQVRKETEAAMPFGFDTRVVALWRAAVPRVNGVTSLVRRVALLSVAVIVISTIAAVREASQNREISESFTNEFAIADSAIQDEFLK
jgi:hypothetical protein